MKVHHKPLSRIFPKGHISEGEPTLFIEKIWESIGLPDKEYCFNAPDEYQRYLRADSSEIWPKHTTIRSGNKVQVGDQIVFFCWSGIPYRSPWIRPFPPIEVKQVWDFDIEGGVININGYVFWGEGISNIALLNRIARNDGLTADGLLDWFKFPKPFTGQVICWSDSVEY